MLKTSRTQVQKWGGDAYYEMGSSGFLVCGVFFFFFYGEEETGVEGNLLWGENRGENYSLQYLN